VEEVDLGGVQAGGAGGNREIEGSDDTDSGFSGDLVGFNLSSKVVDGGISEDEGDLLLEEGDEDLESGDLTAKLLLKVLELIVVDALSSHFDDFLDEGLLGGSGTFLEMTRMEFDERSCLRMSWI
jgi:hypothetical protein